MRNGFTFITSLLAAATLLGFASFARAQTTSQTLTQYYDSARTQPRVRYQAQLRGSRPDTVAHGTFRRYWRTGSLAEHGRLTDGQPDSVWTRYYPTAPSQPPAVARRLSMRGGQPEGAFVVFYPNGQVAQRGTYRQGQLVDSLVTMGRDGQPRLVAHFDASESELVGTFQQWHSRFTAAPIAELTNWNNVSADNPYPQTDSARYWTGQLAAGKLVGRFAENDSDGQPRVSFLFDAEGRLKQVTRYYPARWLRHELLAYGDTAAALRTRSAPAQQLRAAGPQPYLLLRTWEWETDSTLGNSFLSQAVGQPRHPTGARCGPAIDAARRQSDADSLMSVVSKIASFWAIIPKRPASAAQPSTPYSIDLITGQVSVPYARQHWRLLETDTLTGVAHRVKRRELRSASGQLVGIETAHGYHLFDESGKLYRELRTKRSGKTIMRRYANGKLRLVIRSRPGYSRVFIRQRNRNGRMPLFAHRVSTGPNFR